MEINVSMSFQQALLDGASDDEDFFLSYVFHISC